MIDKDFQKQILAFSSELSDERIEWLKDVAWNLARVTRKYDRFSVNNGLSLKEKIVLLHFEVEENEKWIEEMKIKHEEEKKKHEEFIRETEEFIRETDEFIRSIKRDRASSFINYPFPIGEA
jgi:hypothetical protein